MTSHKIKATSFKASQNKISKTYSTIDCGLQHSSEVFMFIPYGLLPKDDLPHMFVRPVIEDDLVSTHQIIVR